MSTGSGSGPLLLGGSGVGDSLGESALRAFLEPPGGVKGARPSSPISKISMFSSLPSIS